MLFHGVIKSMLRSDDAYNTESCLTGESQFNSFQASVDYQFKPSEDSWFA